MTATDFRQILRSFAGGELSPKMLGRHDDVRYPTSVAVLHNYFPTPRGPIEKRRGLMHVAFTKGNAKMRNVPFRFSGEQNLVVGVGAGFFRWFADERPLLFAEARTASSVDTGTDEITFLDPHGFANSASVRVFALDGGGALPNPLDDLTAYTVVVVDAWRITLSGQNLTTAGTGAIQVVPAAQVPPTYVSSQPVLEINLSTDRIKFAAAHQLATNDPIVFTSTATLPVPLVIGTRYFAIYIDDFTIQVAATSGGAAIDLLGTACTFTDLGDVITAVAHGLANDEQVSVASSVSGLVTGQTYFVVNKTADTFQVSTSLGGSAALISTDDTGAFTRINARKHYVYELGDQVYLPTSGKGFYVNMQRDPRDNTPPSATTYWHRMADDGVLEIGNSYVDADLFLLDFSQSGDVMRFTRSEYDPGHLTRLSATRWKFEHPTYTPSLAVPTGFAGVTTRGARLMPSRYTPTVIHSGANGIRLDFDSGPTGLGAGEGVYAEGFTGILAELTDGFYTASPTSSNETLLRRLTGEIVTTAVAVQTTLNTGTIEPTGLLADTVNSYKVTALDERRVESQPSAIVTLTNNLLISGTKNTLSWTAVSGATRYRVYRLTNGQYGLLGETETTTFVDTGELAASLDTTIPEIDTTLAGGKPAAIADHDQRTALGGFKLNPQRIVMSRAGARDDFSYHIPVRADDRISIDVALDGSTVRHLVSVAEGLLVLTSGAVLLARPVGDAALGPETIRLDTLPRVGSSTVTPVVMNDRALFIAEQGKHLRAVALDGPRAAKVLDLSVRANHLIDGYTIAQLAALQSPFPLGFLVRSDGALLALSYLPDEDVLGWCKVDTNGGLIESACCIPDGDEDALYLTVLRGATRSVERMMRAVYLDDAVSVDGANNSAATVQVDLGVSWGPADALVLTASVAQPAAVGDFFDVLETVAGVTTTVRLTVEAVLTGLTYTVRTNAILPAGLRNTPTTRWKHGRKRIRTHLNSTALTALADGVVREVTTDANGFLTLPAAAIVVHAGRRYTADLKTLPVAIPEDFGGGKGTRWNVAQIFAGVVGGPFEVGPAEDQYEAVTPVEDEERIKLPGKWTRDGVLFLRSTDPFPLEVRYLALDMLAS